MKRRKLNKPSSIIDKENFATCKFCQEPFNIGDIDHHEIKCHALSKFVQDGTICRLCKKGFETRAGLHWHLENNHQELIKEKSDQIKADSNDVNEEEIKIKRRKSVDVENETKDVNLKHMELGNLTKIELSTIIQEYCGLKIKESDLNMENVLYVYGGTEERAPLPRNIWKSLQNWILQKLKQDPRPEIRSNWNAYGNQRGLIGYDFSKFTY